MYEYTNSCRTRLTGSGMSAYCLNRRYLPVSQGFETKLATLCGYNTIVLGLKLEVKKDGDIYYL